MQSHEDQADISRTEAITGEQKKKRKPRRVTVSIACNSFLLLHFGNAITWSTGQFLIPVMDEYGRNCLEEKRRSLNGALKG